jgi:hypothetical protein
MSYGTINNDASVTSWGDTSAGLYGFKNRIINGAMMIDQRGSASTPVTGVGYTVDRWGTGSISGGAWSVGRVQDAPSGFLYSDKYTVTGATTAADYNYIYQLIEANNAIDLSWGTSAGQTITLSFWVKVSTTGVFSSLVAYYGPTTQYYSATYNVSVANTWQYVSVTVPAPASSVGAFANALTTAYCQVSPLIVWSSGYSTGSGNTWSTTAQKPASAVNLGSIASATFQITGVQLEKGTTATSFDYRPFGTELALCQRYAWVLSGANIRYGLAGPYSGSQMYPTIQFPVTMRAAPSLSISSASHFSTETWTAGTTQTCSSVVLNQAYPNSMIFTVTTPSSIGNGGNVNGNTSSASMTFSAEL